MKLFGKRTEHRNLTLQDKEFAKFLGIDTNGISSNKAKETTVFTCLRIMSDTISKLPLKLYKKTNGNIEVADDHYMYHKMKLRPNQNMSSSDMWKMIEFQRSYNGHAVSLINTKPNGQIETIRPLDMDYVTIIKDDSITKDNSIWYVYNDGKVEGIFESDSVLHFKGMTSDGITGMSVREHLNSTIENLQFGTQYVNQYFKGGLTAKGVIQYTGDASPEAIARIKKRFEDFATGMKNVGKLVPVPPEYRIDTLNTSMADAQFLELNQLSIRQIAAAFGIKQHMLNDLSGAKFNNVASQNEEFYRDTLLSILTMYEQELTYKLLTEDEVKKGYYFKFNVDSILRADPKTRAEYYSIMLDSGAMTRNEVRSKEELPKYEPTESMNPADKLIMNGNGIPIDMAGQQYVATPAEGKEPKDTSGGGEDSE